MTPKTTPSTRSKTDRAARARLPFPADALKELERELGKLRPKVSLKGWDECPPQFVSPLPTERGCYFDVEAVVRTVRALCAMRHSKGRWAGRPFVPDAWQIVWVIAPVFGWKRRDGGRLISEAYVEIPRKNGKSTLSSGIALVLLAADGEAGAEVYTAAATRDQAKIVFAEARNMALKSPALARRLRILTHVITFPSTGGVLRALSKLAEAAHGLNVHGAVIDELHVHKTRDLVDAILTGTGAREQPLAVIITTADEGKVGTIYEEKHEYARKCSRKIVRDATFYGVIWAAPDDADPFATSTLRSCNPGYGRSVRAEYLRKEANRAKATPSYFPVYCRLHLNRRIGTDLRWFGDLHQWDVASGLVDEAKLKGKLGYAGLDLSSTSDFTAFSLLVPDGAGGFDSLHRFWLPEDRLDDLERQLQVPLKRWVRERFLSTTEGNVVDYRKVRHDIGALRAAGWRFVRIGYDPWNAGETALELKDDNFDVVPVRQGYATMSPAAKHLETLVNGSKAKTPKFRHAGNPILRWMAASVDVRTDPAGNIKPIKPELAKSVQRIDGIVSTLNALAVYLKREPVAAAPATAKASGGDDRGIFARTGPLDL